MPELFSKRIIFECVTGSQLYGIATPESDIDYRGVCLDDALDLYGLGNFEQFIEPVGDRTIYGLKKFANLAKDSNPNIVELFFVDRNLVINPQDTRIWDRIQENKFAFISKRVTKTFVGYVISQRKRMDTHHKWMTGNPPIKPKPEDYSYYVNMDGDAKWLDHNQKQAYENKLKDYQSYETWLKNRNEKRHQLETDYGFDTKHGSHIVRLLEQVEELHRTGNITFPRPERKLLLSIRKGQWDYEKLIEHMENKIKYIEDIVHPNSILPETHNIKAINNLLIDIYQRELIRV